MIFSPYSDMLQNYYASKFETLRSERAGKLAQLNTAEDAQNYVQWARRTLREAFGPFPERTPLNARVVSSTVKDGVVTEAVLFESRPGYLVSGMLCRPETATAEVAKYPGVVGLCGHSENGKNYIGYRSFCYNLARCNFVSFLIDPAGQGERDQFTKVPGAERFRDNCCSEHNQSGKMLGLFDDHFGKWRVWDAIRALDYLTGRPEVDTSVLGVTGCSGGGTLSSYLWALDDRLTMAAPCCYLTSFFRNYDNELPVDAEQIIPRLAAAGFEMADFLICRAPLPAMILAKEEDFFDPRGTRECFAEAEKIYTLLGQPDALKLHFAPGGHGYDEKSRMAMYRFFAAQTKANSVPENELHPGDEVYATKSGNVNDLPGARPLPRFLAEMADAVPTGSGQEAWRNFLGRVHHVTSPETTPDYKLIRPGYHSDGGGAAQRAISVIGVKTEPGILGFLHTIVPEPYAYRLQSKAKCLLHVADFDAESELFSRWTGHETESVFVLDVRGSGKSMSQTSDRNNNRYAPYATEYFYDATGITLDDSLWGGRCRDVLAALRLLRANGAEKLRLSGSGQGAMLALGAALAAPELIDALELHHLPPSMSAMVGRGVYRHAQSFAPRGMLTVGDIPNMLAALPMPYTLYEPGNDYATPAPLY